MQERNLQYLDKFKQQDIYIKIPHKNNKIKKQNKTKQKRIDL